MHMPLARAIVALTLCSPLASPTAHAEFLQGAGVQSCATFAQKYRSEPLVYETTFFSWAQGFMSALNFMSEVNRKLGSPSRPLRDLGHNVDQQLRSIRHFCDRYPLRNYMDAVLDLYEKQLPNK